MKKVLYAVMLLLGLSIFSSCSEVGGSTGGNSWIVGDWCMTNDAAFGDDYYYKGYIYNYFSFSKDGFMSYYEIEYNDDLDLDDKLAWFDNGTLYSKQSVSWEKLATVEYSIKNNQIISAGFVAGTIQKINNDKFVIVGDYEFSSTKTYERIKSFKTK